MECDSVYSDGQPFILLNYYFIFIIIVIAISIVIIVIIIITIMIFLSGAILVLEVILIFVPPSYPRPAANEKNLPPSSKCSPPEQARQESLCCGSQTGRRNSLLFL